MNLYAKVICSICGEEKLARNIETSIGSGMFTELICRDCVKQNYCWATKDELITDFEKARDRDNRIINNIMLELGGVISIV